MGQILDETTDPVRHPNGRRRGAAAAKTLANGVDEKLSPGPIGFARRALPSG